MANPNQFRVARTADVFHDDGRMKGRDQALTVFDSCTHIECFTFEEHLPHISAEQIQDTQGILVWSPWVDKQTLATPNDLLVVSRLGVGYDKVDVDACTQADVAVFIAVGAVDRPMAEATVGWMIALGHHVLAKDRLSRNGQWSESFNYIGKELRDRTLGTVGLGGIARELIRLLGTFKMNKPVAFDPFLDPQVAQELGVELIELDELMKRADFVSVHCPLSDQTRGLIGSSQLELMQPHAYLINTARGGIVDEQALYDALKSNQIAGAAIDTFVDEPFTQPPIFSDLENVLLAPHAIGVTDELMRDMGNAAGQAILDLSLGRRPSKGAVNPEVFDRPGFQEKWHRLRVGN